jgi:hypothetical protein
MIAREPDLILVVRGLLLSCSCSGSARGKSSLGGVDGFGRGLASGPGLVLVQHRGRGDVVLTLHHTIKAHTEHRGCSAPQDSGAATAALAWQA